MTLSRDVLITGAGGFIGSRLVTRLLEHPAFMDHSFTLSDMRIADRADARVRVVEGDLGDRATLDRALEKEPGIVYHLAGVLGGAAEADYPLSRRVNIDATLRLLERLKDASNEPRVVFASSIAVYGPPLPDSIDDDVWPLPSMSYGAQKLMIEAVVQQFSSRGWIDGMAIRLPGIVARADADTRQRAAFFNLVFFAARDGTDFTLPVSADGTSWLISVPACIDSFVHAGSIERSRIGRRRAFNLPAQVVRIGDLVDALGDEFPQSRGRIGYDPDEELDAQFARQPRLSTAIADEMGFTHDGDLQTLIRRAIAG